MWGTGTRLADGKVLFVGGLLATGDDGNAIEISTTADPTAEIYDSATGVFTVLPAALGNVRSAGLSRTRGGCTVARRGDSLRTHS